jgi:methylisocitrate lyase
LKKDLPMLREKLKPGSVLTAPGVCDAFTALLVQHLGFDAAYLGGNALGVSLGRGQPFLEGRDVVEAVSRISSLVEIPVIVDAGTGFGDASHVSKTVRAIEVAGASALHIDDQIFPKRAHYHRGVTQLAPVDVVVHRLEEAVRARRGKCMIVARSDALRVDGRIETHMDRLKAYIDCGVDGLMVLGSDLANAATIADAFPTVPLFWTATLGGRMPVTSELAASPYVAALYPFHGLGAMTQALLDVWGELKRTGVPGALKGSPHDLVDLALDLVDMPASWEIEERTLGPFPKRGR